jgi:hypothetical protein
MYAMIIHTELSQPRMLWRVPEIWSRTAQSIKIKRTKVLHNVTPAPKASFLIPIRIPVLTVK